MPVEIAGSAPGKKRRWIYFIVAAVVILAGGLAYLYFGGCLFGLGAPDNTAGAHAQGEKYTCGMHPFIITDKPGNCPICGMTLTKIEGTPPAPRRVAVPAPAAKPSGGERKILFYRNPMNPKITSQTPAKDEMGMDFVPVYEDETKGGGGAKSPEGYATVQVGAERIRLAGIQSAPATRETISRPVRAAGVVVADETRVRRVQSKIDGWVEKLHSNFTGQLVTKGQPLLEIYSPELVATQREYLLARAGVDRMKESPYEDTRQMSSGLAQAARTRLKLFDVPESFIEELERTGKVRRTVTLNAPVSGYVTGKEVFEGTRVSPGMDLLTVTDLSRVWIEADLYEYEAQSVRVGQTATLETVADPGAKLKGRVSFIYPTFSPETRTLKVRFEFPNPGLRLKPQMYASVSLDLQGVTGVVIPDSALIETGVRQIVFVDAGDGSFEPREVKVGVRGDGKAQILSGVKAGENVAVRANFLLDSESKLRAALTKMTGGRRARPSSRRGREITPVSEREMNPRDAGSPGEPVKESFIQRVIGYCAVNRYLTLLAVTGLCAFAVYTLKEIRLDALPDLSDTQVIVYSRWDRSPDIIEDQVTYPIVTALLGAPNVKAIRGFSDFGFSYVYVIFQDGTDIYWARSRVLEYLSKIQSRLPKGVQTELGPDATGVGWVYQYALVDNSGTQSLDELRTYQDWTLRYALQSVPGVAEVASIGGFQKQYQVTVDPNKLASYGVPLTRSSTPSGVEQRGRRTPHRVRRRRIHGAGPRVHKEPVRPRKRGGQDGRRRHPGPAAGRRPRGVRPRDPARGLRPRRAGRPRRRHRGDAPRGERAQRHRPGQGEDEGTGSCRCRRGWNSSRPTTAPT